MATISGSPPAWPMSSPPTNMTKTSPAKFSVSSAGDFADAAALATSSKVTMASESEDQASPKAMSFTPKRGKAPPRAWERRPATPFVARSEGQKIWKRVPLGDLGVDSVTGKTIVSRKEEKERADYVRVVKRLKVDQQEPGSIESHTEERQDDAEAENNSDKENSGAAQDLTAAAEQRQQSFKDFCFSFIGTKTDENAIEAGASPRKKVRQPIMATPHSDEKSRDTVETDSQNELPNSNGEELQESENEIDDESRTLGEHIEDTHLQQISASNADTETQEAIDLEPAKDPVNQVTKESNLSSLEISFDIVSQPTSIQTANSSENQEDTHDAHTVENKSTAQFHDELELQPPQIQETDSALDVNVDSIHTLADLAEDPNSESPQIGSQTMLPRTMEDDDTAFLHDFLSRAKAQRAAREVEAQTAFRQVPSDCDQQSTVQMATEGTENGTQHINETSSVETATPTLEAPSMEESLSLSPLRRSTRTATIKSTAQASRTKALPHAIQLKRANGNEFIFTANKAQGAANIALLTRSNTKRNKGTAASVGERLRQMNVQEERTSQSTDGQSSSDALAGDTTGAKMNISKKRKKDRGETSSKAKKALRWNEEELIKYREASPVKWADDDDLTEYATGDIQLDEHAENMSKAVQSALQENTGPSTSDAGIEDEPSKTRVRRVRRGVAGTINGTPAPKKRSRNILEEDENMTAELDIPSAAFTNTDEASTTVASEVTTKQTAGTTTTKKSRMPVPVATPGKQLRQPTTSARHAGDTGAVPKPVGSNGTQQASSSTEQRQELPARRKLRVRG